jgi:hypothetical protein
MLFYKDPGTGSRASVTTSQGPWEHCSASLQLSWLELIRLPHGVVLRMQQAKDTGW